MSLDPDLPQRPRNHVIEEESLTAVRHHFGPAWIVEQRSRDYGIDLDIEVVNDDDSVTGLRFGAQLKATDNPSLSEALRVRFTSTQIQYMAAQMGPVLVIRYHSPTKALYCRWFHRFELAHELLSKTATLRLNSSDRWNSNTKSSIRQFLEALRDWQAEALRTPIEVGVRTLGAPPGSNDKLALELRQKLQGSRHLVTFAAAKEQAIMLTTSPEESRVDVLDLAPFVWEDPDIEVTDGFAQRVSLALGMVLYYSGKDNMAGRLLSTLSGSDLAGADPNLTMDVGRILTVTGREKTALKMAGQLVRESDFEGARALSVGVFDGLSDDRSSFDRIAKKLDSHLQKLISLGADLDLPAPRLSRVRYSRGNLLFNRSNYREALREYRYAALLDPEYRQQSYWWAETGATLFELGRYRMAAEFYRKAEDLDPAASRPRVRRADALMHAGAYEDALAVMGQVFRDEEPDGHETRHHDSDDPYDHGIEPWWYLKATALGNIVDNLGVTSQQRDPERANQIAESLHEVTDPERVLDELSEALDADLLCHEAWHMSANAALQTEMGEGAQLAAVMALVTDLGCASVYALVLGTMLGIEEARPFVIHALQSGYMIHGDALLEEVVADLERGSDKPLHAEALTFLEEVVQPVRNLPWPPKVSRRW